MEAFQLAGQWRLLDVHFLCEQLLPIGTIVGEGTPYPLLYMTKPSTFMEPADKAAEAIAPDKRPLFSAQQGSAQGAKLAAIHGDPTTIKAVPAKLAEAVPAVPAKN